MTDHAASLNETIRLGSPAWARPAAPWVFGGAMLLSAALVFSLQPMFAKMVLPRVAGGEISAFALTETHAGSDPATLSLKAEPTPDGSEFILNGEKLWCTNGVKAGVLVVMARTPSKMVNGKERKQITAFIVDVDSPGLEITYRCRFMGLRALYNGVVKFTNVRVPRENIIGKPLIIYWSYDATTENLASSSVPALTHHFIDLAEHFFTKTRWRRTFMLIHGYYNSN